MRAHPSRLSEIGICAIISPTEIERSLFDLKWQTLRHNGIAFPPPHDYRELTIKIKNRNLKLDPLQEEMLLAWAKKKDTPYVLDPVFQKNFLGDFVKTLPEDLRDISLADIDFRELNAIADREKTANLSDEEKKKRSAARKAERDELKARYGTATLDGNAVEIGAYLVEPPGILMGRGNHPLRGRWKYRVQPKNVTLNLDEDAAVPPAPEGHHWGKIVHDHDAMWIANWWDELAGKRKYIWLAETSHLRQERDKEKYLKAQKLESGVEKVREKIRAGMSYEDASARRTYEQAEKKAQAAIQDLEAKIAEATQVGDKDARKKFEDRLALVRKEREELNKRRDKIHAAEMKTRQIATVSYLIDRLAMRVGDEKDEDEADTVGASTLRVEHVHICKDKIEFDFLGKDSVQWQKFLPLAEEQALARNLEELSRGKQPSQQIFDQIDSTHVNRFLGGIVPGLTAKVFRTYHATTTVRNYLRAHGALEPGAPNYQKEYTAKLANLQAAIVCNHKRTPPKNWEESLQKKGELVEKLREKKPDVAKLEKQIPSHEASLKKFLAAQPDPQKLQAQLKAREQAVQNARAALAALPNFDEQIKIRQAAFDKAIAEQKQAAAATAVALKKKQAVLAALDKHKTPKAKKALAQFNKRLRAARRAVSETKKANGAKLGRLKQRIASARKALDSAVKAKRDKPRGANRRVAQAETAFKRAHRALEKAPQQYAKRVAQAREALEKARQAPTRALKDYEERVEKAARQYELAKQTRDYNLGTSLKNYIDPRVYKSWGEYVEYDWQRLYTTALKRKFTWVNQERTRWRANGDDAGSTQ